MKKLLFLTTISCLTVLCVGQQNQSRVDFMKFINPKYVMITDCSLSLNRDTTIAYFYYEIDAEKAKSVEGCFFAIPKKNFTTWSVDYRTNWKQKDTQRNRVNKLNITRNYLLKKSNRSALLDNFDLYVFCVSQSDLFVSHQEINDKGKMIDAYDIKEGALVYTYQYENNTWVEKAKESIGSSVPRTYGNAVVEKILRERFSDSPKIK